MAGHNAAAPLGPPEDVNHGNPPARRIKTLFEAGAGKRSYVKPRDARAILDKNGLDGAVSQCVELKALVNTILSVSGAEPIP